ncbi:MAG: hypothetical protein IIB62_12415, partial [Proteobacteria bacterium]|nr:hypothetical protein [Pseudomonadota bacterium]
MRVGDLVPHPLNWRVHTDEQRAALDAAIERVGFADAPKVYRNGDGQLMILDGHLRVEQMDDDAVIPVQMLDVDDEEARFLIASYDGINALANGHPELTQQLLDSVVMDDESAVEKIRGGIWITENMFTNRPYVIGRKT